MVTQAAQLTRWLEALRGAYAEIDAMCDTYDDYAPAGPLCDQIEDAIAEIEAEVRKLI